MSSEALCFADGDLGRVFGAASTIVLTLPEVKELLAAKLEDTRKRVRNCETSDSFKKMYDTKDVLEDLQDFCANDADVRGIQKKPLRLRRERELDDANAHIANMQFDDDGNVVAVGNNFGTNEEEVEEVRKPLKRFEVVQLASLLPQSVDEAVQLIPSLRFYNEDDLADVIQRLGRSI